MAISGLAGNLVRGNSTIIAAIEMRRSGYVKGYRQFKRSETSSVHWTEVILSMENNTVAVPVVR